MGGKMKRKQIRFVFPRRGLSVMRPLRAIVSLYTDIANVYNTFFELTLACFSSTQRIPTSDLFLVQRAIKPMPVLYSLKKQKGAC